MATTSDALSQDGGYAKLQPYLVALVRWCVSCLWSTATLMLRGLMVSQLPQIMGASSKPTKPRPAGRDHLHPEPRVDCVVLYQPHIHNLDVIFVHGLYGSLGNTWRQGEWRHKYKIYPDKIHLRRPEAAPIPCPCAQCNTEQNNSDKNNKSDQINNSNNIDNNSETKVTVFETFNNVNEFDSKDNGIDDCDSSAFKNLENNFFNNIKKILPQDDAFITEKFYNNTLMDQVEIYDNYETQARFVSDLFKNCDYDGCEGDRENNSVNNNSDKNNSDKNSSGENESDQNNSLRLENCKCEGRCETGCGCICDKCYSSCWPKDWIKADYPDARVISINYTSDPHLWRPLWIKGNKRLCLHERADQMMKQLLDLGVGRRPVVWVGHSKGGLFIKQIYCEAYEAYLKTNPQETQRNEQYKDIQQKGIDDMAKLENNFDIRCATVSGVNNISVECGNNNKKCGNNSGDCGNNSGDSGNNSGDSGNNSGDSGNNSGKCGNNSEDCGYNNYSIGNKNDGILDEDLCDNSIGTNKNGWKNRSSNNAEDATKKSFLWSNSIAFMFYSVPHRGSPLADIKTPITARSVELMEISKDNSLVLSLQDRWLAAISRHSPLVRSLVETRRTLMSVLWLRIVSADSADPGTGALCGVSVDHREICKPTSRHCVLYKELYNLIKVSINKLRGKTQG